MSDEISNQLEAWFQSNLDLITAELIELINLDTSSPNEERCFGMLKTKLEALGLSCRFIPFSPEVSKCEERSRHPSAGLGAERYNLQAVTKNSTKKDTTILFSAHVDVVPASADFPEAFDARVSGEYLIGRGACDNKNNIIVLINTLRFLKQHNFELSKNVVIDLVVEEEIGGNGALSSSLLKPECDQVIVLEPTSFEIFRGHRGCITLEVEVTAQSAHMGNDQSSNGAIEGALLVIESLRSLEQRWISEANQDPAFSKWQQPVKFNLGTIHGGEWHGSVAEKCRLGWNIGFHPKYTPAQVIDMVRSFCKRAVDEFDCIDVNVNLAGIYNDAYLQDEDSALIKDLLKAVSESGFDQKEIYAWNASCDARLYAKIAGLPVVIFGSGELEFAHSNQERIKLKDLKKGIEILSRFLVQ